MGSSFSSTNEYPPSSTVASANPPAKDSRPPPSAQNRAFKSCWSCRVLSGCTFIGAGTYVYLMARKPMKLGVQPGPGTIVQMVVGISIACWGVIVMIDPEGKSYRV
ncbi:distal membrane-arm assembly complex protein 1 [Arvicanthis niloticus]|uniref:distal membrane-arm assembly complex protein 1 n=1 Tax=Arvicanthis niloticus TaxID=61156 RepID=UPI001486D7E2|nr:distal membrane-arm assembly complex protein 1 [Arvicanthis niloticus]